MFQFPGFAFYPYVFRIKYLLSDNQKSEAGSLSRTPRPPASKFQLSKVGFPIRKSAGQRPFAPHHSLSQRTTSFIASYRQGIHQMPLGRLIALISNAHLMFSFHSSRDDRDPEPRLADTALERPEVIRDKPGQQPRSQLSTPSGRTRSPHQLARPANDQTPLADDADLDVRPLAYPLFTMSSITASCFRTKRKTVLFSRNGSAQQPDGGARRDRTDDLMLAKHALSQLSYGPYPYGSEQRIEPNLPGSDHEGGGPGKI